MEGGHKGVGRLSALAIVDASALQVLAEVLAIKAHPAVDQLVALGLVLVEVLRQVRPRRNSDGLTEATKSKMRGKPKPKKAPASEPASRVASRPHSPLAITRVAMHGMYATKAGHLGL